MFQDEIKTSNVPHFDILRAPIGDILFCANYVAQKRTDMLQQLAHAGPGGIFRSSCSSVNVGDTLGQN